MCVPNIYMNTYSTRHSRYNINYHFVWKPKDRRAILVGQLKADLPALIDNYAAKNGIQVLSVSIQPNHVHLFVSALPPFSPAQLINLFKGATARELLQRYPNLKPPGSLWFRSYYVGTAGTVSSETIQHYLQEYQEE